MRRLSQSLILIVLPTGLAAQGLGPLTGSWGAEARTDAGGAVLRFRSDAVATVFGFRGNFEHNSLFTGDQVSLGLRLGRRRYSRLSDKTRPYRTLSVLTDYTSFSSNLTNLEVGLGLELGTAHFFTQHISVGASGELSAAVSRRKTTTLSGSTISDGYGVAFSGFRVFGGVYF